MNNARLWWPFIVWACALGCENPAPTFETGQAKDIETTTRLTTPQLPAPPTLPSLGPCPQGWRAVAGEVERCDPWPVTGRRQCGTDQTHFVATPECQRIGSPCPAGDFADGLPTNTRVLYVMPTAPVGGNGSQQQPLRTLASAVGAATPGTIIALSKGTHIANGPLPANTTLRGACVAQTFLTTTLNSSPGIVYSDKAGVSVQNLTVTGTGIGAKVTDAGATLSLRDVLIEDVVGGAVAVIDDGRATLENVVVRRVKPTSTGLVTGISALTRGSLEAKRVVVEGAANHALMVSGVGTRAIVADSAIIDTVESPRGFAGEAVAVYPDGFARLERTVVEGSHGAGIVAGQQSGVELFDVVVRNTRPAAAPAMSGYGYGVQVIDGALLAKRLWCDANTAAALDVIGPKAKANISDAILENTGVSSVTMGGAGLFAALGSYVELERALLAANATGVEVTEAAVTLVDITAARPTSRNGLGSPALSVMHDATVTLSRARFDAHTGQSIFVAGNKAVLTAHDVLVQRTRHHTSGDAPGGLGLVVAHQGHASFERAVFEHNQGAAVFASTGGALVATDISLRDGAPVREESSASGITTTTGGNVTLTRARIERANGYAVFAAGADASVTMEDVFIADTKPRPAMNGGTVGVLAYQGGAVRIKRFRLTRNGGFGFALQDGQIDATDGEVSGHVIGVNIVDTQYDVGRVDRDVSYVDNQRRLDAQVIPLPPIPMLP